MTKAIKRLEKKIDFWMITGITFMVTGILLGFLLIKLFVYVGYALAFLAWYWANSLIKIKEDIEYDIKHFGNKCSTVSTGTIE